MGNRTLLSFGSGSSTGLAPARFRVMACRKDYQQALVSLAETRAQAVRLAEQSLAAVRRHRRELAYRGEKAQDQIHAILVEEWIGTATDGRWQRIAPEAGGFWHRCDGSQRDRRAELNPALPQSGEEVAGVLLSEKTRKGGWRAKLVSRELTGPITNTAEVPDLARAGQSVTLIVEAVNRKGDRIQFRWSAQPNETNSVTRSKADTG